MFCKNCGAQLEDGQRFCPNCGQPQEQQPVPPQGYAQPTPAQSYAQPTPAQSYANPQQSYANPQQSYANPRQPEQRYAQPQPGYTPAYGQPLQQTLPMNWHKFLVYFALWAGALANLFSGIRVLTGEQYDGAKDAVYAVFPGMKTADLLYGIVILATVAFGIYTAVRLLQMKVGAPKLLLWLYVLIAGGSALYVIASMVILSKYGLSFSDMLEAFSSMVGNLIGSVVMILINSAYYKKREHLFVN